jgi:hypothetical protein
LAWICEFNKDCLIISAAPQLVRGNVSEDQTMSGTIQELSGTTEPSHDLPRKGEHYRCQQCGIEIEVTIPSQCENASDAPSDCCDASQGVFKCFGHVMERV